MALLVKMMTVLGENSKYKIISLIRYVIALLGKLWQYYQNVGSVAKMIAYQFLKKQHCWSNDGISFFKNRQCWQNSLI